MANQSAVNTPRLLLEYTALKPDDRRAATGLFDAAGLRALVHETL